METASSDASYTNTESDVLNATSATDTTISSARSTSSFAVVNRQELIQKIEQLKKKWTYGIQFAYVLIVSVNYIRLLQVFISFYYLQHNWLIRRSTGRYIEAFGTIDDSYLVSVYYSIHIRR